MSVVLGQISHVPLVFIGQLNQSFSWIYLWDDTSKVPNYTTIPHIFHVNKIKLLTHINQN